MFEIQLIAVGRLKEKFYLSAAAEYEKRLSGLCRFHLTEIPEIRLTDNPSNAQIEAGLAREAQSILAAVPRGAWLCVLAIEGKELNSTELADRLREIKLAGKSCACFVIGSSYGLDPAVKEKADLCLSMSRMTFPHHLARVMVLEQLYRAESIQAGSRYHK